MTDNLFHVLVPAVSLLREPQAFVRPPFKFPFCAICVATEMEAMDAVFPATSAEAVFLLPVLREFGMTWNGPVE